MDEIKDKSKHASSNEYRSPINMFFPLHSPIVSHREK